MCSVVHAVTRHHPYGTRKRLHVSHELELRAAPPHAAALGMQREDSFVTGPYTDHDPQRRPSSPRSTTTRLPVDCKHD